MAQSVTPFLMFQGDAEGAIALYLSLFADARIEARENWKQGEPGKAGAFNPGAILKTPKQSTGKRLTPKEREKQKKLREKEARRIQKELREKRKGGPNP